MEADRSQVILVKEINPDEGFVPPHDFTEFNDKLYFTTDYGGYGNELWVTDGTIQGTQLVKDINNTGNTGSDPMELTVFDNRLYFRANDGNGHELWVSDGTTQGTQLVKDINPGSYEPIYDKSPYAPDSVPNSSYPSSFTELNDRLYFEADDEVNGHELWVTDGTTEGTQLLKDINPGSDGSYPGPSDESQFTQFNGQLYFDTSKRDSNENLVYDRQWVSDGTAEGTQPATDLDFNFGRESVYFNDKLYFNAGDEVHGGELWVSDGTPEGSQLVKDINPGSQSSSVENLTASSQELYFTADNGVNGLELWVSDGTEEGTQLVRDINPGSERAFIDNLTVFNDILYFAANNRVDGDELWVSDGTEEGTQLLKDIAPGTESSYPNDLTVFNNRLYFTALNEASDRQLWVSDGTEEGTQLVGDFNPSSENSSISDLTVFGNELFFSSNNKLFKIISYNLNKGTNNSDELNGTSDRDRLEGLNGRDTLTGDAGNDKLFGGAGDDSLFGGADNDVLIGGAGNDVLTGGAGDDFFALATEGEDTITDFQLGSDLLGLAGFDYENLTFADNAIYADDRLLVNVLNINTENLTTADFI